MPLAVPATRRLPATPRVLVAEDDTDILFLLTEILRSDGYEVLVAKDVEEFETSVQAATLGRITPFDLIVADVYMPGRHGTALEVLGKFRQSHLRTPVLLITAYPDEHVHMEASRLGVSGVMAKPFDMDDFRMAVLNLAMPSRAVEHRISMNDMTSELVRAGVLSLDEAQQRRRRRD